MAKIAEYHNKPLEAMTRDELIHGIQNWSEKGGMSDPAAADVAVLDKADRVAQKQKDEAREAKLQEKKAGKGNKKLRKLLEAQNAAITSLGERIKTLEKPPASGGGAS